MTLLIGLIYAATVGVTAYRNLLQPKMEEEQLIKKPRNKRLTLLSWLLLFNGLPILIVATVAWGFVDRDVRHSLWIMAFVSYFLTNLPFWLSFVIYNPPWYSS